MSAFFRGVLNGAVGVIVLSVCLSAGCEPTRATREELIRSGNRHLWRAEYVEAIGPFKGALEYDASDPEILYKIGQCYSFLRDYREAVYWYRRALRSYPGHTEAAKGLAEAQRMLDEAPEEGPGGSSLNRSGAEPLTPRLRAQGLLQVARTHEARGDLDKALDFYKQAVQVADDEAFSHAELGRFYVRTGQTRKAIEQLQQARKLNPYEPGVAEDLARLGVSWGCIAVPMCGGRGTSAGPSSGEGMTHCGRLRDKISETVGVQGRLTDYAAGAAHCARMCPRTGVDLDRPNRVSSPA